MIRFFLSLILTVTAIRHSAHSAELSRLKKEQRVGGFQVQNLYSDSDGKIMGAKFIHSSTGTPVFLLQLQTVPQVFTWVDTPTNSNQGLPHALEHLLVAKGVQGHYFQLLHQMRLTPYGAATFSDFVAYGLSSEGSVDDFFESFHALLAAMYRPDFSDAEASKEFYHFGVSTGRGSKKTLIEEGTVYDEMRATQDRFRYYSELNKRIFGAESPFAFRAGGDPDQMRSVTPEDIRQFHDKYYRPGPSTGFIFVFPPQENVSAILRKISDELQQFSQSGAVSPAATSNPKYPFHSSNDLAPAIYPFPSPNAPAPGFIRFAWRPGKADSQEQLNCWKYLLARWQTARVLYCKESSSIAKPALSIREQQRLIPNSSLITLLRTPRSRCRWEGCPATVYHRQESTHFGGSYRIRSKRYLTIPITRQSSWNSTDQWNPTPEGYIAPSESGPKMHRVSDHTFPILTGRNSSSASQWTARLSSLCPRSPRGRVCNTS